MSASEVKYPIGGFKKELKTFFFCKQTFLACYVTMFMMLLLIFTTENGAI